MSLKGGPVAMGLSTATVTIILVCLIVHEVRSGNTKRGLIGAAIIAVPYWGFFFLTGGWSNFMRGVNEWFG